jgi:hypothetical protein
MRFPVTICKKFDLFYFLFLSMRYYFEIAQFYFLVLLISNKQSLQPVAAAPYQYQEFIGLHHGGKINVPGSVTF